MLAINKLIRIDRLDSVNLEPPAYGIVVGGSDSLLYVRILCGGQDHFASPTNGADNYWNVYHANSSVDQFEVVTGMPDEGWAALAAWRLTNGA